jgi:nucleoside 2-deoxyribosyltransferase
MPQPTVYLAGPISGLHFNECTDWREYAIKSLAQVGIKGLSPMRCKDYLESLERPLSSHGRDYEHLGVFSASRSIMTRDRFDATRCDVVLANLAGAKIPSIGTVMEIAWADLSRIPVVCAIEKDGNPHEHMMISEAIGFRVQTLDQAIEVVKGILI